MKNLIDRITDQNDLIAAKLIIIMLLTIFVMIVDAGGY